MQRELRTLLVEAFPVRSFYERRELPWITLGGIASNALVWLLTVAVYHFNVFIPLVGLGVLLLNSLLAVMVVRKERVLAEALVATSALVQILLMILLIRLNLVR